MRLSYHLRLLYLTLTVSIELSIQLSIHPVECLISPISCAQVPVPPDRGVRMCQHTERSCPLMHSWWRRRESNPRPKCLLTLLHTTICVAQCLLIATLAPCTTISMLPLVLVTYFTFAPSVRPNVIIRKTQPQLVSTFLITAVLPTFNSLNLILSLVGTVGVEPTSFRLRGVTLPVELRTLCLF